ncbi:MAG: ornithine carbamoyltransferase [Actinomycetota bacterium]
MSGLVRPEPHPALAGRSVLTLRNHPSDAVHAVLDLAASLKGAYPRWPDWLRGRVVALIFEKPSTRTRVSFAAGVARLGGDSLVLSSGDLQIGRGESIEDTALVLSRMVDAIVLRTGPHSVVEELARHATVPVVNGLTHAHHPCQALADAQTLRERFGELAGLPIAYLGDGNNCCVSLAVIAAHTGMAMTCGCPEGYLPDPEIIAWADAVARERGGSVRVVSDPVEAVAGARALYTDVWVSMGDEEQAERRLRDLTPYRVDGALLSRAAGDAVVLHPLPAHYGEEVTHEVLHGPRSAVWDEAENRVHAQAALLAHVLPAVS